MSRRIARFALAVCLAFAVGVEPAFAAGVVRLQGYVPGPPPKGITPFPLPADPTEAVFADFNSDNLDDLAVLTTGTSDWLRTYMNDDGWFTGANGVQIGNMGTKAKALTSAYLNPGSVPDLAVVSDDDNLRVYWMGSDGVISLPNSTNRMTGDVPVDVAAAELDTSPDAFPELLTANSVSWNASVFDNTGAIWGLGAGVSQPLGADMPRVKGIESLNANDDDYRDIAVMCGAPTNQIRIIENQPLPFGLDYNAGWNISLPAEPTRMIAENLDDDVDEDLVVTLPALNQVLVLLNNGGTNASFTATSINIPGAKDVEPVYFDADWEVDLVVYSSTLGQVYVLRGRGDGTFYPAASASVAFETGDKPLSIGYVNDDFKPDIAVTDVTNRRMVFIQNTSAPSEYRIDGATRYETAVNISRSSFADGGADAIVLATGTNFPDALTGAPLAAAWAGPILLTPQASLPSAVANEIKRVNPKKVFILGGYAAVSTSVEASVKALGYTVVRLAGANRYETAYKIGLELKAANPGPTRAYVCTGDNFPDALSASAPAAMEKAPILLVTKDSVPAPTANLKNAFPTLTSSFVVGGTGVISDTVKAKFPSPTRLAGANRYDTSAKVVAWTKDLYDVHTMTVATGVNFPDALGGGAVAPDWSTPLLLVPPAAPLPQATKNVMGWWGPSGVTLRVLGGTKAFPASVVKALMDAS